ncbi:MAG: ABC transporter ATP-binding protein [Bacteroidales bacterium]|jgi:ABC-2 type transport system ATP-binding protein|nr:ABC transporter ATP-binding protein [Bacteroidales bacterium]MDN5350966.1 type transport system ATP-binding protein [Bacteroidales bacterium]
MIQINDLKKSYSGTTVLNIPTLSIEKGVNFGLVGNNGAGKTTLFRLLLDLIRADQGEVFINGENVAKSEAWKHLLGSYLDQGFLIDFLSPEEYFSFVGKTKGMSTGDIEAFLESMQEFFNGEVLGRNKLIRNLSAGNQQKTGIAAAMMGYPKIVVLDEPFNSLDPTTQSRLVKLIKKTQETSGVTFLISSHDLNHIAEVCDRIVVLREGEVAQDIITGQDTLETLKAYFAV